MEWQEIHTGKHNKYVASVNEPRKRRKRAIVNLGSANTCTLSLRSDPLFWDRYLEKAGGVSIIWSNLLGFGCHLL